ncbi:MAG TPA: PA14 domain-containing protein, partial [Planctomycetota bacterium]|nr:PA14 domain-containing protein [Planctomycetota bacterium]
MQRLALWACALSCVFASAEEKKPGLIAEFFTFPQPITDFPIVKADTRPLVKRVDTSIDFPETTKDFAGTTLKSHFFVRWSGTLRVADAGTYTFYTDSDDGSLLFIDGRLVVDNRGLHGMQEEEGEAELIGGDHDLRLYYIQGTGDAGCVVRWQAPGKEKETLPAGVLFHDAPEEEPATPTRAAGETLLERKEVPEPAALATLEEKIKSVLPTEEEDRWLSVGWRRSLHQARVESQISG